MIVGFGTAVASISILTSAAGGGVADAQGEFLVTDTGAFFSTDTEKFLLTNVEILSIQTDTSLGFATETGDTLIGYIIDGETTSAPDPE
jgi:hypothetical protein